MPLRTFPILCLLVVFSGQSHADDTDVFIDRTFASNIQTVQLYVDPLVFSDPALPLHSPAQLRLKFDDLDGDKKNYYYTIVQCDYDWTASELHPHDYINGFTEQDIRDYEFSFNTYQSFTHYFLLFPNADMRITKSGNYVIKVYLDNDPEQVVLTRRFIVYDNRVQILSEVKPADDVARNQTHHQVNFSVVHRTLEVSNPISEIKVLVMQNFRWDQTISGLQPQYIRPGQLDYFYGSSLSFAAGNEFRWFDSRTFRYRTDRVEQIIEEPKSTTLVLFPDEIRSQTPYFYHQDNNGKFVPGIQDYIDQDAQADYAFIHFRLKADYPIPGGKIYLLGRFSDWRLLEPLRLQYNATSSSYETTLYLKQGYYDYIYWFVPSGDGEKDAGWWIEGSDYEASNTYQIFVYYRPFGSRYDQVIGYKATDTFNR